FRYVVVPMARIVDNALLLDETLTPPAQEEPQIIFRNDTTELFDEEYGYGRRPKIEMLWRLGKQRGRLDVGRQHLAVAIDDIRPRRGDPALRTTRHVRVLQAEIDEPAGN
ncbi:hypothetical protein, partial [Mesorhizobium sp. M3A.F.Ca.ET.175.01.1.1]|uniref:hypothetical protein n=1 Tax=Mesorhizobium sp. M3A.F.Ca.ET.175.01.1.1 TaxID=2563945 RepID=UPI001FE09D47